MMFNLGEAYWADQKYDQALDWYKKAEKNKCPNHALQMRVAGCLARTGQQTQASVVLENFIAKNPPKNLRRAAERALTQLQS